MKEPTEADIPELVRRFHIALAYNKLATYGPYQWQKEFHAAGLDNPERMLMAANRVGKTQTAGAEVAIHLTGDYDEMPRTLRYPKSFKNGAPHPMAGELIWPDGWQGKRFKTPTLIWTGSPTNETSKDIVQTELLGGLGVTLGTGWVPRHRIHGHPTTRQAGVKNVVDSFQVKHRSGGLSICILKTYEQGWQKWQGTAPHVVWMDEEPDDYKIFSEAQTRILTSQGILLVTFTPLQGMTDLVEHFMTGGRGIYIKGATWDDAPHLNKDDRDRLASSYRAHEREARTKGIPMMGEGAVFPVADEDISVDAFPIPPHWARGKGCDFGIDHPAAGVECAWDRDADIVYVIDCYKKANETAPYHAAWFNKNKQTARIIPVAWPHDGMNREKSGGKTLAQHYQDHAVNMMGKSARYPRARGETSDKGGPQPVEPIVDETLERMSTGRLKVFSHLRDFFEEKRSYHRKDGKIVPKRDDILKAFFYALMMKRYWIAPSTFAIRHAAPSAPIASMRI
jgi:phage terminase large subunit-like protein